MKTKWNKIFGFTLLIFISAMLMTGCGFSYVMNTTNRLNREDAKEFIIEKTRVEPITDIDIHTSISEVELLEADDFYVDIDYLYWEEEPEYSIINGKLLFDDSECFPNSYQINFNLKNRIRIYLPKGSNLNLIRIEDASGDVNLSGFTAEELDITVSYGDFTMDEATATKADITLASGNSKITDFQVGKFDYTNSYGAASFTDINTTPIRLSEGTESKYFNATMSSGNVEIKGLITDSVDITNSYGSVTMDRLRADDLKLNLSSGDCKLTRADIITTDIRNSYGDVTLQLTGAPSSYSLDLDTSYGKIRVDDRHYEESVNLPGSGERTIRAELSSGDVTIHFEE